MWDNVTEMILMEINHDCVRELMLDIEKYILADTTWGQDKLRTLPAWKTYGEDETLYCLARLIEADYVNANIRRGSGKIFDYYISSLTWTGHEYLDNIRDDGVWKSVKEKTKMLSGVSLQIMGGVALSVIKQKLGLV